VTPLRAAVALAAIAAFVLCFALARATAPAHARGPQVRPLTARGGGVALPHLSQATPLPGLARPAPKPEPPPTRTVTAPAAAPKPKPLPPVTRAKPRKPVVIVGSG
jgi:hypothetical protein